MVLIGMLHHRKNPIKVSKSYAYAAVSKAEGAELLFFSPKTVDFNRRIINGYMYKQGKWKSVVSRFPDVIYNAGTPVKLKKSQEIINKLKKRIPFTTNSIGNKFQVYNRLLKDGEFSQYLIPTEILESLDIFVTFIKKYHRLIVKPIDGHRGEDIIYIETNHNNFNIHKKGTYLTKSYDHLLGFIEDIMIKDKYIIQPYIKSKTKNNLAYDFRLHSQKNGKGKWVITAIYPRIGKSGSIITNINQGGYTNYAIPFLKEEFGEDYSIVNENLEQFCLKLSSKMDEIQMIDFNETLDEIGIDIGIDEFKRIWIYEINWRPGCPPAFYLELDVVKNMIRYALYLANKKN